MVCDISGGVSDGKNWFLLEPALSAPSLLKNLILQTAPYSRTAPLYLVSSSKRKPVLFYNTGITKVIVNTGGLDRNATRNK